MIKIVTFAAALTLAPALTLFAAPAAAQELFGGLYKHNVNTPLSIGDGLEQGVDVQIGYRAGRVLGRLPLEPYVVAALNSAGDTSFAAAGLSWKFGNRFYIRPGVGIAIHNGSADKFFRTDRIAFGSRILFEPEVGVGARIDDRLSIEASWVHLSHAQLFGGENPGIDNIGARLNFKL